MESQVDLASGRAPNPPRMGRAGRVPSYPSWLFKPMDAVLTAPLRQKQGKTELIRSLLGIRTSKRKRIAALVQVIDKVVPGTAARMSGALLHPAYLPFRYDTCELFAYGTGSTVFRFDNGEGPRVVKIFRRSLGGSPARAWKISSEFKAKHRTLTKWFNGPYEIVVPSEFCVLHSPLLGTGAAAVIQPFVAGRVRDPFVAFTLEDAVRAIGGSPGLRAQMLDFTPRFLAELDETGLCFDLVGRNNLMLVGEGEAMELKIVDNGLIDARQLRDRFPARFAQLQAYIARLQAIYAGLKKEIA